MFSLLLYFLLSMLIIQYKISVMMCFLLPFKVIFYILRNKYPALYCIPRCCNSHFSYRYCDTHIKYIFIGFDEISNKYHIKF